MSLRTHSNAAQTAALGPAELVVFHRRKLHRVMEIAEAMAELSLAAAQRNAIDRVPDPTTGPTAALEKLARLIRRTVLLDQMLDEPVRHRRPAAEIRYDGVIETAPAASAPQAAREPSDREGRERLDRPDFLINLNKTTPDEVIAEIERDLCIDDLSSGEDPVEHHNRIVQACQGRPPGAKKPAASGRGFGEGEPEPAPHPHAHRYWGGAGGAHGPPR